MPKFYEEAAAALATDDGQQPEEEQHANATIDALGVLVQHAGVAQEAAAAAQADLHESEAYKAAVEADKEATEALAALREAMVVHQGENVNGLVVRSDVGPFEAVLGAKGERREVVNKAALVSHLGQAEFMDLATVKLGDIDKYVGAKKAEDLGIVKKERTGPRHFKVVRRPKL